MAVQNHTNFAYSAVVSSPGLSGTSLTVTTGQGALFPTPPFSVTIWPAGANAISTNAEICLVTAKVGDVLTITRSQEGSTGRTVLVGDQIAATITALTLEEAEILQKENVSFSADSTYAFSDLFMIDKIVIRCVDAGGATVSIEKLVATSDIMFPIDLVENEFTSVTMDIFPTDIVDSADTTIYFKTTGDINVTVYKRKL